MQAKKSELIGLLVSDGSIREYTSKYTEFDKRRNKRYNRIKRVKIIEFINTNKDLIERFRELLKEIYNYNPNVGLDRGNFRIPITKNYIIFDIKEKVRLGHNSWTIPRFIISGNKKIKKAFIRGFFDGDGSTDISKSKTPRVRLTSTNRKGIKEISELLLQLELNHSLLGPYRRGENRKPEFQINIKKDSIIKFINEIGSYHSKKRQRFKKILHAAIA